MEEKLPIYAKRSGFTFLPDHPFYPAIVACLERDEENFEYVKNYNKNHD